MTAIPKAAVVFVLLALLLGVATGQGENTTAIACRNTYVDQVATANATEQVDYANTYSSCLNGVYGTKRHLLSAADEASYECDVSYNTSVAWIDKSETYALAALKEAWKECKAAALAQKEAEALYG